MAADQLGSLGARRALVLGAGEMGEGMVEALAGAGVSDGPHRQPHAASGPRHWPTASAARPCSASPRSPAALADVDVLLTSTGAAGPCCVEHADLEPVLDGPADRPLLIVDIAVPRDVDSSGRPAARRHAARHGRPAALRRGRASSAVAGEVVAVQGIVDDELERFDAACSARAVAPLVATLHERAEQVRLDELDRFASRLDGLDDRQREAVEALTRGILAKLLHGPTVKLKDLAGTPRGERLAEALRELYDLELD